ncbi:MAG: phage portal protein, partial [Spirochaetota bacterium]
MKISLNLDFGRRDKRSDETSTWDRPSAWLINALGGGKAKSGVVVTETTALNLSAVYGATAIISGSIASMPLMLYRRLPDGSRERATRHPLYRALHVRPNARMTPYQWKVLISHHVDIWGNSYNYIDRSRPEIEFIPLLPDRTRPVVVDGRLKYTTIIGGQMLDIPPRDMLHIAGLGFDGRRGYGVVSYAKQSLGLALAIEEFGSQFFANDATPGGVIEHPNAFKGADGDAAVKRLRQSWEEQHRSMDNKHKIAILEEGAKYHQLGVPPEQAQFLASRKFNIAEVARWFGLPLSKLKDLDRAIQANMEQQSLEYFQDCLLPRTVRIEQAIEAKLRGEEEREEYYVKFLHAGLLRADVKTRNEAYEIQRRNGV